MKTARFAMAAVLFGLASTHGRAQAPAFDTKPAFMQIVTNLTYTTNPVVVTNYVVVTNAVIATNYYNAQGQILLPVDSKKPSIPGLIPIPEPKPATPDPALVKDTQLRAVRDLLVQALLSVSNQVSATGSFTSNANQRIQVPQGVTSFDRKKTQALLTAMNATAEKAAPEAVALLAKMAAQVKTEDPNAVLHGDPNAATHLLISAGQEDLEPQLLALVQQAGTEPKLRETYNSVMLKGGGLLGSVLGTGPSVNIESHVAQGLLRAITNNLVEQEGLIRSDASLRKTRALKEALK